MTDIVLRPIENADASALAELQSGVFDDYERSDLLSEVIAAEAAARPAGVARDVQSSFGLAAYRDDKLVGWSQGYRQGRSQFYMLNAYSTPSRTPFRSDGGQHSAVMADAVPR
jgi:hypothetical protein